MARNSGRICNYFLEGRCRFGDNCWYEHPRHQSRRVNQSFPQNAGSSRRGAWNGPSQQYNNPVQPSSFSKSSNWFNNRDSGSPRFSQNRYVVLSANESVSNSGTTDEEEKLLEIIMNDMEIWESSGQWMFSTYSPMKEKPNISGFSDFLPEELRLEYYNCRANNNLQSYINSIQELVNRWRNRLHELKKINASTRTALISELKNVASQPQAAFGFGGSQMSGFGSSQTSGSGGSQTSAFGGSQASGFGGSQASGFGGSQASGFGVAAFPVETSAENFSFKTASELASISSTNTPAFGSSAPSSADSHSVGFGNPPSSTAAFSFKTAAPSGGFGMPGFSGFGKPFPASSSTAPSASVFRTGVGTPAVNPGNAVFGQLGGGLESNVAVAASGSSTSVSSEKLFTPKNELSPEELKQFEARKFTLGKIPLKPPPVELLSI